MCELKEEFHQISSLNEQCFNNSLNDVDRMLEVLKGAQCSIVDNPENVNGVVEQLDDDLNFGETRQRVSSDFKGLHQSVTKFAKLVDKRMPRDLDSVVPEFLLSEDDVNSLIIEQWLREGRVSLAEHLMKLRDIKNSENATSAFVEIRNLVDAIRNHNVQPCIEWANRHVEHTKRQTFIDVCFKLHRLQYLQLVEMSDVQTAITYAKTHLLPFYEEKAEEVQALAGCLIVSPLLPDSPYADLVSKQAWLEAEYEFTNEYCRIEGFASSSPLHLCLRASKEVMPKLLKYQSLMASTNNNNNTQNRTENDKVAQVGVHLDKEFQFHSTFVCPVTKEESTPVLLECGHCISRKAMDSIVATSRANSRSFKCPYCPHVQVVKKVLELHI